MTDAPSSLGDFFKQKKKKQAKGTNLNNEASTTKVEDKKSKTKDKEEEGWEDEQILAPTMMVQVAGILTREEDVKDQEDTAAPAWGSNKPKKGAVDAPKINEKRFPTLAKAMGQSSNINIDDGSQANINIKTTKNVFSALEDDDGDEDAGPKRPKEIKPAMVSKVKGEFEKVALQREVAKYKPKDDKKKGKKKKKKDDSDDSEEESEDEEEEDDEEDEEEIRAAERKKKADEKAEEKKKKAKEEKANKENEEVGEVEIAEDLKIVPDEKAARAKYIGREKLETKPLPRAEIEEEKKDTGAGGISKKKQKFMNMEEDDGKKKLLVADWD